MYHTAGYVEYMKDYEKIRKPLPKYKIGFSDDVPAFPGFYNYSKCVGGSSLLGTNLLTQNGY